ncbi:MAG: diaminopimelate epimerase [Deltaproteobacteria bacterium GWC2_42_11]|nr:MAG: diaminopimelate epimerase [Deltaproteobacteria bacterium GWC2_42_11]
MNFTKMHGLGNDFIVIDCRNIDIPNLPDVMKKLSHRQFGIGFDQALILFNSSIADFKMDIYNADGGRVEMCGNGIRCFAKYIWDRRLSDKDELAVETLAGIIKPRRIAELVQVDMGEPILEGRKIPVDMDGRIVDYKLDIGSEKFFITCVSMGNPHCVIFVDNVDGFDVRKHGPLIENHALFPKRTNIEFVQVLNKKELKMRVWERGSGETPACGTGACASLIAASLKGFSDREAVLHLAGGDLDINWSERDNHVYMTGPAAEVFEGSVNIN